MGFNNAIHWALIAALFALIINSSFSVTVVPSPKDGNFNGYIVELEEKPFLQLKAGLEKNYNKFPEELPNLEKNFPLVPLRSILNSLDEQAIDAAARNIILQNISKQRGLIDREHGEFLGRVKNTLKKRVETTRKTGDAVKWNEVAILREYKALFNGFAIVTRPEDVERIEKMEGVKAVYPNRVLSTMLLQSVPLINADETWKLLDASGRNVTGKGVSIAVIDTGIDYTHEAFGGCTGERFLDGNCEKIPIGYDFLDNDYDAMDVHSHGTHVAATAAGKEDPNNNNIQDSGEFWGVAPDATIYAYKVCNEKGQCMESDVIAAMERSVDPNQDGNTEDHVDIVSMSLGNYPREGGWPDNPEAQVANLLVDLGVTVVAAAGNAGGYETVGSPSSAYKAISVGASTNEDWLAYFSSRGPAMFEGRKFGLQKPDILAPGYYICAARWQGSSYSTCFDSEHISMSGTSMACPHVSGAAALILQKHPDWMPQEIKMALRRTAKDLGYNKQTQGYGRIDVLAAASMENAPAISLFEKIEFRGNCLADLYGIASAREFKKYVIELGQGLNPGSWQKIFESDTEPASGMLLGDYNTCMLSDGFYSFKLVVEDTDGGKSEDIIYMNIDRIRLDARDFLGFWEAIKAGENYLGRSIIEIKGSAYAPGFGRFAIEWGEGKQPAGWSSDGITLASDGLSPVFDSVLAVWDTRNIEESGLYKLRLTVFSGSGEIIDDLNVTVYVETTAKEGSPKQIAPIDSSRHFCLMKQPTIHDIDNDGKEEILFAYENKVFAYNEFLEPEPGWPVQIASKGNFVVQNGPAVADIDNDGVVEIVVGEFFGRLDILQPDGKAKEGWPKQLIDGEIDSVTLADLENDGILEIIFGDWEEQLHVFDISGVERAGFPVDIRGLPQTIAVADLDNDGRKEIVFETTPHRDFSENMLYVIESSGEMLEGWPKDLNHFCYGWSCRPALGDVSGDGNLEIIAVSIRCKVYPWDYKGELLENFPVDLSDDDWMWGCSGIAIPANIDSDAVPEVIIGTGTGEIYALNGDGNIVEDWPLPTNTWMELAEITLTNGEKGLLSAIPNQGCAVFDHLCEFRVFYTDGNFVEGFPKNMPYYYSDVTPSFGDFDGDGNYEIVFVDMHNNAVIFDLPAEVNNREWPVFARNAAHTSAYYMQPHCGDKTLLERCSNNKPLFCTDGFELVEKCSLCGCPQGHDCNTETEKCVEWTDRCIDGTYLNECSDMRPLYCSAERELIHNCGLCGCPESQRCIDWNLEQDGRCIEIPETCGNESCEATLILFHEGQEEHRYIYGEDIVIRCLEITAEDMNLLINGVSGRAREQGFYSIGGVEIFVEEIEYSGQDSEWLSSTAIYILGENEKNCPEDCNGVCLDSDLGENYVYRGVINGTELLKDYCSDEPYGSPVFNSKTKYLNETLCPPEHLYGTDTNEYASMECLWHCLNGACIPENTCGNSECDEKLVFLDCDPNCFSGNFKKTVVDGNLSHEIIIKRVYPGKALISVDGILAHVKSYTSYRIAGVDIYVGSIYSAPLTEPYSHVILSVGRETKNTCSEDCWFCCIESDADTDFLEKGITQEREDATFGYIDRCIDESGEEVWESGTLREYYCSGDKLEIKDMECECSNGVCLSCHDGTLYGQCTESLPHYCEDGWFVANCSKCGCPEELLCNASTGQCETKPDLTLYDLRVNPETDEVSVTVVNYGGSKTGSFYVEFWMDSIPKGTIKIESLEGLGGSWDGRNNRKTIRQHFNHGLITGRHTVMVNVDYTDMVQELDENNNAKTVTADFGEEPEKCGDGLCESYASEAMQIVLLPEGETKIFIYSGPSPNITHKIECISVSPGTAEIRLDGIVQTVMQRYDYNINGVPVYVSSIATDWPEDGYSFAVLYIGDENPVNCPQDCNEECGDSDKGKEFTERGFLKKGLFGYIDSCTEDGSKGIPSGSKVIENYCENNERKSEVKECPNGCVNGACSRYIAPTPRPT